jgi:hypothetical protein
MNQTSAKRRPVLRPVLRRLGGGGSLPWLSKRLGPFPIGQCSGQDTGGTLVAPQPGGGGSSRACRAGAPRRRGSPLFGSRRAWPSGDKPACRDRPFAVRQLLLKLLCSLRALLFGLDQSGSGAPPLCPALLPTSHSFHLPENPAHPGSTPVAQVWKPALRPTGASSERAVPERARWKIPHMNTIPGHDGPRYLGLLLFPRSPFESASHQRRLAVKFSLAAQLVRVFLLFAVTAACPKNRQPPRSSCQRQKPFDQHLTPRIPRIMPSSVDTISRALPASTHWRSARCQRWSPSGVCPVYPETPPLTSLTPATPTNSNAFPSTLYARRNPSDFVRKTCRMGGQTLRTRTNLFVTRIHDRVFATQIDIRRTLSRLTTATIAFPSESAF